MSPLMLPSNVVKCMLNVASTMLPATFGEQPVAVECCLSKICLVYALFYSTNY